MAVRTEKDGLVGSAIKAIRYVGRYDPQAEDKKKFDISAYDVPTLIGIQSRLAAVLFKTNPLKLYPVSVKERNETHKVKNANTGEVKDKLVFATAQRLPPNTAFYVLFRIGRRAADNALTVGMKQVQQQVKIDKAGTTKIVRKTLDKKDPVYRAFMKARRFMPAAFKGVLLPPKRTRGANKKKTEADDE